jgi:hypothetical protein
MKKIILTWSFWNKKIDLEILKTSKQNKNIVLNIHWAFWKINEKYRKFWERLVNNNIANVVLYSSSRLDNNFQEENLTEFELKQKLFEWKVLDDEVKDWEIVINYILENSENLFWIKKEEIIFTINWNSLWWIIALKLAELFPEIKNINIVWTWAKLDIKWTTLLDSYPDLIELQELLWKFKWNILVNSASLDVIFDKKSYELFYKFLKNANKSLINYIWADHSFKKINWEKSDIPYLYIYKNVADLINWKLNSWEINLENIDKKEYVKIDEKLLKKYFKEDKDWFWE